MKIIILASGKGSRLGFLTNNTPKPLIDLGNGKTVLETQLENIQESGVINEVVVVAGHYADQIEAKIRKYQQEGMKIKILHNPFYDFSNNLITLWLAKHEMDGDFMITNGDNIFDNDVFFDLADKNKYGIFLTIVKKGKYYNDDMKIITGNHGLEKVSKSIANEESHGESVGLALVSGDKSVRIFRNTLEELGKDKEYLNKFWLEVINKIADRGGVVVPFEIDLRKWMEIDLHVDLKELLEMIQQNRLKHINSTIEKKGFDIFNKQMMQIEKSIEQEIERQEFN
ncbi:phosphocholine cytidylyltransferase family protein [Candidatus Pacearchaeota archaeon]|nr:phosphocholine cytidylyltransferase family protein [Candidatus Pacearchaeota archaeon]